MSSIYDPQSQQDLRWAGHELGVGVPGATIGRFGCFITVAAMILTHYLGRLVSPDDVNVAMDQLGLYVATPGGGRDLFPDSALPALYTAFGGVGMTVSSWDFTKLPADLSKLVMDDTQERLIVLDFNHNVTQAGDPDGWQVHAVRDFSWDGKNLVIDDPWYGTRENWTVHYGPDLAHNILRIVGYAVPSFVPPWKRPSPPPDPCAAVNVALQAEQAKNTELVKSIAEQQTELTSWHAWAGQMPKFR